MKKCALIIVFIIYNSCYAQKSKENFGLLYFKKAYKFDINNKIDSAFYYYNKAEKQFLDKKDFVYP